MRLRRARKWRNGRRARLRTVSPKGRGGSSPPFRTTNEKRPGRSPGVMVCQRVALLDLDDVGGARALGAVDDLEPHPIALVERAVALGADLRVVDENVRTTLTREET